NYSAAISWYKSFISNYKGENFVKDAYYKIYLANYLSGDTEEAGYFLKKAGNSGTAIAEEDKYAERQIASNIEPNIDILKIRLATDGGLYNRADSLVQLVSASDFDLLKDQVEFVYRKARLLDKMRQTEKAIEQYKLT